MGILDSIKGWRARIKSAGRVICLKAAIFTIPPSVIGLVVYWSQEGSVKAANIAGGVSAVVAISAAFYVLHPRLNYWLLPHKTRRDHNTYVAWLTLTISNARVVLAGSRGCGGARTNALGTVHLTSRSLPTVPPSLIDTHFGGPADLIEEIAGFQKVAEEVIGTRERALEDPRLTYQMNLITALGLLLRGVGYELGGHGHVTDLWEQNLADWVMCAQRQYRALKRPLGAAATEDQLLTLLDRLHTHEFNANATKPLREGDLVRIRTSETEWIDTLKLTSDPVIVDRRETGLPVWKLEVVDAVGAEAEFTCDRTAFEPAPSG
jgi:hypothetical protein